MWVSKKNDEFLLFSILGPLISFPCCGVVPRWCVLLAVHLHFKKLQTWKCRAEMCMKFINNDIDGIKIRSSEKRNNVSIQQEVSNEMNPGAPTLLGGILFTY